MRVFNRTIAVVLAGLLLPAGAADAASAPESLRLLPPVLFEGEPGWTLAERMEHYKAPAVSIAVVRDGKIAWAAAYGLADRETALRATTRTLFQAGSISKSVAAAGVLAAASRGRLSLEAPVNTALETWKLPENDFTRASPVTLERLLNHSAGVTVHGFPGYAPGRPVPTIVQVLDGVPPANTPPIRVDLRPGSQWRYSGGGYTIAQVALSDAMKRPFAPLLAELVLGPAGMSDSTYEQPLPEAARPSAAAGTRRDGSPVPGKRHTYPEMAAAGLWTTATDLAKFAIAIQRAVNGAKGAILPPSLAARMTAPLLGDYGLGLAVEKHENETYVGHDGADEGFQALLLFHRDKGLGAAVMANSDNGIALAREILRGVARADDWPGYLPAPLRAVPVRAEDLAPLAGRYALNGDDVVGIEARGTRLFGRAGTDPEYELYRLADGSFARKERTTRYRFEDRVLVLASGKGGADVTKATRLAEGAFQPGELLAAGKIEDAKAAWRRLKAERPGDAGVAERHLNGKAYELSADGEHAKSLAVAALVTELYPLSANALDTAADVTLRSGDREGALALWRRVLDVLPRDPAASEDLKRDLKEIADRKIRELAPKE
jgi:CubicO group peptidase (beta-lactamase class C family)